MYNEKVKKSSRFGYSFVCNLLLLLAGIVIIVALCFSGNPDNVNVFNTLMIVGCGIYVLASVMTLIKSVAVLFGKINHRSPEYKQAITVTVFMVIVLAVAAFGLIWAITLL